MLRAKRLLCVVALLLRAAPAFSQAYGACEGAAWDALAPLGPVRSAPAGSAVTYRIGPVGDVFRIGANGLVSIERHGLPAQNLCQLYPERLLGLRASLDAAQLPTTALAPTTGANEWEELSAEYDRALHFVRIAMQPAAVIPPSVAVLRARLRAVWLHHEQQRTTRDFLLDEVRRFVMVWSLGRSLHGARGAIEFRPTAFAITRFENTARRQQLWVQWMEQVTTSNSSPTTPVQRRQLFEFLRRDGGWELQRPASMPARRPTPPPLDYPGEGELGGERSPVFRPVLVPAS